MRRRLDAELVRRGLASGRDEAITLIGLGRVRVGGAPAANATRMVDAGEPVTVVADPPRFVGRGGEKLDAALESFGLDVTGANALDAGASTGGFTDCLLQRGATHVVALDVGRNQLHERLRRDPRVTVLERTNLRDVDAAELGTFDVVVADLSFISLRAVMAPLVMACAPEAAMVPLVKPQFEVERAEADRGRGVITEPSLWRSALGTVADAVADHGASVVAAVVSPIRGASGNTEFLLQVRRGGQVPPVEPIDHLLDRVVAEAADTSAAPSDGQGDR